MDLIEKDGKIKVYNSDFNIIFNENGDILNIEELSKSFNLKNDKFKNNQTSPNINIKDALQYSFDNKKLFDLLLMANNKFNERGNEKKLKKLKREVEYYKINNAFTEPDEDTNENILKSLESNIIIHSLINEIENIRNFDINHVPNDAIKLMAIGMTGGNFIEDYNELKTELNNINTEIGRINTAIYNGTLDEETESQLRNDLMILNNKAEETQKKLDDMTKTVYNNNINIEKLNELRSKILIIEKINSNINNINKDRINDYLNGRFLEDLDGLTINREYDEINDSIDSIIDILNKNVFSDDILLKYDDLISTIDVLTINNSDDNTLTKLSKLKEFLLAHTNINKTNNENYLLLNTPNDKKDLFIDFISDIDNPIKSIQSINILLNKLKRANIYHQIPYFRHDNEINLITQWCIENNFSPIDITIINNIKNSDNKITFELDKNRIIENYSISVNKLEKPDTKSIMKCWYILEIQSVIKFLKEYNNIITSNSDYIITIARTILMQCNNLLGLLISNIDRIVKDIKITNAITKRNYKNSISVRPILYIFGAIFVIIIICIIIWYGTTIRKNESEKIMAIKITPMTYYV